MKRRLAVILLATLPHRALRAAQPAGLRTASPRSVLETARGQAAEKLESPGCRLVLADFRDSSGRTLAERLARTGLSAPDFLSRLEFRDGRNEDVCHRRHLDACTVVGGSTVWTCPGGSLSPGGDNLRSGANTLIHEMLHALGLGENPPLPLEITRRVRERCGL